jgi:hypothetical protein
VGFIRLIDDVTSYVTSDIKAQTGKGFFKTFLDTGNYGEFQSYKYLFMTPGKREFIHNCYLPSEKGFTEIDLLMIHETGLYVVESKNYSGWIFGDEKQKEWTQILAGGKKRNRFYNPVWQNAGHIKALQAFFSEYQDVPIYSLVVFSERCELKKVTVQSENVLVIKRNKLKSVFKKQIEGKSKLSSEVMIDIYQRLLPLCKIDEEERKQHIDRINDMKKPHPETSGIIYVAAPIIEPNIETDDQGTAIEAANTEYETNYDNKNQLVNEMTDISNPEKEPGVCPRCGAILVERNGKNGPFIGCTGFPKCRYTSSISK